MKAVAAVFMLILGSSALAQLPDAPHPHLPTHQPFLTHTEQIESAELITANLLDYTSTYSCQSKPGCHELVLPQGLVDSKPAFMAYKIATTAAQVEGMRLYDRLPIVQRHHSLRIAGEIGVQAIVAFTLKTDAQNYSFKPVKGIR